jgi:hypothetical protein
MKSNLASIVRSALGGPKGSGRQWLLPISLSVALLFSLAFVLPAFGAPCVDADSDGYVTDCGCDTAPAVCVEDCNDNPATGGAAINPGATEVCNDVDDDCDGSTDEGFAGLGDECPYWLDPPGCDDTTVGGCCESGIGEIVCKADGTGTECAILDFPPGANATWGACFTDPSPTKCWQQLFQEDEPPAADPTDASCFDGKDNDCDDLIDHAETACRTAELCDGFDNDFDTSIDEDFTDLGDSCSVGFGVCEGTGEIVCNALGTGTECNATEGIGGIEGPPGNTGKCNDGLDNDCDGLTDYPNDADCLEAEVCDGFDNDNLNGIDDTFTDLGDSCTVGNGACQVTGNFVCKADGTGTVCNATPNLGLATTEGPTGATCNDGIDNDCDGDVDGGDADCSAADLYAWCSLEYLRGKPGSDCTGWHVVDFGMSGDSGNATMNAELLALDLDGKTVAVTPLAELDELHLASRVGAYDYLFKSNKQGDRHWDFAPIPMVRITVEDGGNTAYAYCSNIPYLERIKPSEGKVISASEGDSIKVVAAIPRVDPATLELKIDGIDVFTALSIVPADGLYLASGNVMDNGDILFTVSDLIIDVGDIHEARSNTISFNLSNLGCGGHIVVVEGDYQDGIFSKSTTPECYQDELYDNGTLSVFAIFIDSPTEGEITYVTPTPVEGEVCHGREIESIMVNGKLLDDTTQAETNIDCLFTPGVGDDSADSYDCDFDTTLPMTDLAAEVAGTSTGLGTFDPGSNKLHALAEDDVGNRTHTSVNFSLGDVSGVTPASLTLAQTNQFEGFAKSAIQEAMGPVLLAAEAKVSNAMVLGMETEAISTFFAETCASINTDVKAKIVDSLKNKQLASEKIDYECDPTVTTTIYDAAVTSDLQCVVTLEENNVVLTVTVPTITASLHSDGYCCDGCDFICWVEVTVDQYATATLSNAAVQFKVSEGVFLGTDTVKEAEFVGGTYDIALGASGNDVGCIVGFFQDLLGAILDVFFFIFTFGQVSNPVDFSFDFEGIFKSVDLVEKIGVITFPDEVKEIKINEQLVADEDKLLTADLKTVEIKTTGFMASLEATFSPTSEDAEIEETPGSLLSPATPPSPVVQPPGTTDNTYFVVSDDTLNQLFGSMTTQGEIKTQCVASGICNGGDNDGEVCVDNSGCPNGGTCEMRTVGDLLPPDCSALTFALPIPLGICEGMKVGSNCEDISLVLNQGVAQGTCWGTQGANCETIPTLDPNVFPVLAEAEKQACRDAVYYNVFSDDPILFCGRADVPPAVLINDDFDVLTGSPVSTADKIETTLRMNDLLVGVVIDRDGGGIGGELNALSSCFVEGADTTGDCKMIATCLDLNFAADLSLDGLKIKPAVRGVQIPAREEGQPCDGGVNFGGDTQVLGETSGNDSIEDLKENIDTLTPPLQSDGLDLGGIVNFNNPRLISIQTTGAVPGDTGKVFQDYIGITGDIEEKP